MTIDERLKTAAIDSFNEEFAVINGEGVLEYNHEFSERFKDRIAGIADMTEHNYVRFGGNMLRRSLVAALIAVMVLASCGIVYALGNAAVSWVTQRSGGSGNVWNIWFESIGEGETYDTALYKPVTPPDLTVVSENYDAETASYEVVYNTEDGKEVAYIEVIGVNDDGKYFGASATGQNVEDVTIGYWSGKHFYNDSGNQNTLIWTDGYSLFMVDGEYDYDSMLKMCENLDVVPKP